MAPFKKAFSFSLGRYALKFKVFLYFIEVQAFSETDQKVGADETVGYISLLPFKIL